MKHPYQKPFTILGQVDGPAAKAGHGGAQHPMTSARQDNPRTVIRGESFISSINTDTVDNVEGYQALADVDPYAAHTDWLNCTIPTESKPEFLSKFINQFYDIAGEKFAPMTERGSGLNGWRRSFKLSDSGALLGIGGQNGTAFLSLSGEACMLIPLDTWPVLSTLLNEHYNARITRWDGAVDDFGGCYSVDWAVEQYKTKQFNAGGNKPSCNQQGNWLEPDGRGRTFYVGRRKNGKLIRIYEKGKQLGNPDSPWVRWELELHNRQREIPWDVLINPGGYVAGAYPCTRWVSEQASRIRTIKKSAKIGYDALTYYARLAYGPLINVMIKKEGSPEKVLDILRRDGLPARLDLPRPPELRGSILAEDDQ